MSSGNQPNSPWRHAFFTVWVETCSNAAIVYSEICSLFGGIVVPRAIHSCCSSAQFCPATSSIIHNSHWSLSLSFSVLATPTYTGWKRHVHQPGRCRTSTPNSLMQVTTEAIIWNLSYGTCKNLRAKEEQHVQVPPECKVSIPTLPTAT